MVVGGRRWRLLLFVDLDVAVAAVAKWMEVLLLLLLIFPLLFEGVGVVEVGGVVTFFRKSESG